MTSSNGVASASGAKRSTLELSFILGGVPFCVSGLLVGGALSPGLTVAQALVAALAGAIVLTIYAGAIGSVGARTGLATTELLVSCFGRAGAVLVGVVLALCLVGWYAVQTGFFGKTINVLFPGGGTLVEPEVAAVWGGLLMLSSAVFGIRGLAFVSIIGVPLFAVLTGWGLGAAVDHTDVWAIAPKGEGSMATAISMVIGSFAVGATVNADVTRYARGSRSAWIATIVGFLIANVFVMGSGAITTAVTGTSDLIGAMVHLGLGVPALLVLIFGQWTTNDNNLYYATTNLHPAIPRVNKKLVVVACGVTATLLGAFGIADHFVPFLLWLGVLIPPVGGVIIAHYLILQRETALGATRTLAVLPFLAWIGGSVIGKTVDWGVPALNSVVAALLLYLLFSRVSRALARTT